ncbi:MAG: transcriptional regulator [Alphaproteobacteria bacterium]|nr:transcriptional regulator [Alphaproteobacteria bacterium]
MTLNKGQKLVKMVELMNRRGGVRAVELLDRFGIDPRTLRRYLADLRELGLPVEDVANGFERTISLDPAYRRAGVQLTLPEVLSLHFGRTLFTFLEGTQFAADLADAIERLEPAIPRAHADLAKDLDRRFMAVPEHAKDYSDQGEVIDELITALIYHNPARVSYTRADGSTRRYVLHPYTVATYRQGLYLFARDANDLRVKTFAVERFERFERLRLEKFVIPEGYNPQEIVADCFGIISGPVEDVILTFDRHVERYVRERTWHRSQTLESLPDGRVRLTLRVGLSQELTTWVLGFAGAVEINAPASLKEQVREEHRRALERLGPPTKGARPDASAGEPQKG